MVGQIIGGIASGIGSMINGAENRNFQREMNDKNAALQREFAQNSIQWKVNDAKKAGIHPLAALGASTYSASPSFVSGGNSGVGDAVSSMGQAIGDAVSSKEAAKEEAKQDKLFDLEVKQKELENAKLASEIAQNFNSSFSSLAPDRSISTGISSLGQAIGKSPPSSAPYGVDSKPFNDVAFLKNKDGTFSMTYGSDIQDLVSEATEERLGWKLRNQVFGDNDEFAKQLSKQLGLDPKKQKVVSLPWRPGSGSRFKVVPANDKTDYRSWKNRFKALFYQD